MADKYETVVGPEGRVLIPVDACRAVGLELGMRVVVRVEGEHVVLLPPDAIGLPLASGVVTLTCRSMLHRLASRLRVPAVTADRSWSALAVGVEVRQVRSAD